MMDSLWPVPLCALGLDPTATSWNVIVKELRQCDHVVAVHHLARASAVKDDFFLGCLLVVCFRFLAAFF